MAIPLYIEAPYARLDRVTTHVFVAGGITNCENWQKVASNALLETGYGVYNPRREDFPMDDPSASEAQIAWEYHALQDAEAILFWFTADTLQPISLFELGRWTGQPSFMRKPLFVGCDPDYARLTDVQVQLGLARPDLTVYTDLHDVIDALVEDVPTDRNNF